MLMKTGEGKLCAPVITSGTSQYAPRLALDKYFAFFTFA